MPTKDPDQLQLEARWLQLREQIGKREVVLAALTSELKEKREQFKILDDARTLVLKDPHTNDVVIKQALALLEKAPDVSPTMPISVHEAALRYVYASPVNQGVTAREVAKGLQMKGYGSGKSWKNFYTYVTVSLNRWEKRKALQKMVPTELGRGAMRFSPASLSGLPRHGPK